VKSTFIAIKNLIKSSRQRMAESNDLEVIVYHTSLQNNTGRKNLLAKLVELSTQFLCGDESKMWENNKITLFTKNQFETRAIMSATAEAVKGNANVVKMNGQTLATQYVSEKDATHSALREAPKTTVRTIDAPDKERLRGCGSETVIFFFPPEYEPRDWSRVLVGEFAPCPARPKTLLFGHFSESESERSVAMLKQFEKDGVTFKRVSVDE